MSLAFRLLREVCRSIRNALRIGSRRVEVGSTTGTALPMRGAPVRTIFWVMNRCSSLGGCCDDVASGRRHSRCYSYTGGGQNPLQRQRSNGRANTERSPRKTRRRWWTVRSPAHTHKPPGRSPPADTCPTEVARRIE